MATTKKAPAKLSANQMAKWGRPDPVMQAWLDKEVAKAKKRGK